MTTPAPATEPEPAPRPQPTPDLADAANTPDPTDAANTPGPANVVDIVDVAVIGAGPTGLLIAGDLASAGLTVTLIERRPQTAANLTRAFAVHARTLELLDARGLADELVATGSPIRRLNLFGSLSLSLDMLPTRFPFVLITPQFKTEHLLERRALSTGVDIRYDHELIALRQSPDPYQDQDQQPHPHQKHPHPHQDPDTVALDLRTPTTDRTTTLYARHVVGADGVRSTVRRELGLPFPGRAVVSSMVLADVRLTEEPPDQLAVDSNGRAFAFLVPFGDGWYRAIAWHRDSRAHDDDPVGLDELRATTRAALGTDHGMHDARWISRFHADERQVPHYRVGRVFLAGDAAHVHSPAGGQGMNTGLQDAANLSWKLAAVLLGRAPDPEALLDSYERERHPVGRLVLRGSGALTRITMAATPARRALRDAGAALLAQVRPARDRALGMVSGIGISYPPPPGAARPAGRRAPDAVLREGRLYELLRAGGFVLITPPGMTLGPDGAPAPAAPEPGLTHASWRTYGRTACVLVRPDGYVAWSAPAPTAAEVDRALAGWILRARKE
ncbi:FAD-dependent oxidoreductase [Streptomyces sp. NPDC006529]|uniref:FAD-dependent oxidoreductase n=1 Tax=Streptomyces sp. NPDC006529 TaxID=3157177 RepID=UPI0033A15D04